MQACPGCQAETAERAAFCLNCGRALGDLTQTPTRTPTPTPTERTLIGSGVGVTAAVVGVEAKPFVAPLDPEEQLSERTPQMPSVEPIVVPRPDRPRPRLLKPVEPASIPSLALDLKTIARREPPTWESRTFFQRLTRRRRRVPIGRVAWIGFALGLLLLGASLIPIGGQFFWERLSPFTAPIFLTDVLPAVLAVIHLVAVTSALSVRARAFAQLATAALILIPRAIVAPPAFAPDMTTVQRFVSLYLPPILAASLWWRSRAYEDIVPRIVAGIACVAAIALIVLPFGDGRPSLASAAIETIRRAQLPDLRAFALPTVVYGLSAALGITATLARGKGIAGIWAFVVLATFTVWLALVTHAVASEAPSRETMDVVRGFSLHGIAQYFGLVGLVYFLAPSAHDA